MSTTLLPNLLAAVLLCALSAITQAKTEKSVTEKQAEPAAAQDNLDGTVKPGGTPLHSFDLSASYAEGSLSQQADDGHEPAPAPPPKRSDEWEFTFAPYFWASSLRAEVDVGIVSSTADVCFSDLAKELEMGGMLRFEGLRDNRWGFYLDGTFMKLGDDFTAKINVDAQLTIAWLDFGGMYRFGKQGRSLDLMLGGRYTYMGTDVTIGPLDFDYSDDYVSPVVGGRVQYDLSEKWLVSVQSDLAGFGVGIAPTLVWGVTAFLGYHLNDRATLGFGYRYYDIGISGGNHDVDLRMQGPIVGVAFQF